MGRTELPSLASQGESPSPSRKGSRSESHPWAPWPGEKRIQPLPGGGEGRVGRRGERRVLRESPSGRGMGRRSGRICLFCSLLAVKVPGLVRSSRYRRISLNGRVLPGGIGRDGGGEKSSSPSGRAGRGLVGLAGSARGREAEVRSGRSSKSREGSWVEANLSPLGESLRREPILLIESRGRERGPFWPRTTSLRRVSSRATSQ